MARFCFAVCLTLAFLSHAVSADKPNIVYILADDFGYGDARCYNPEGKIQTPNIDRLAKEGMRFTDAHSGSSVCSPTRYGILTGRYAWRTKLRRGVLGPYDSPLIAADRLTVPSYLKNHGYQTACVGKWHLGWDWPKVDGKVVFDQSISAGPTARGFDSYFGTDVPNYPPYCFIANDRTVGDPTGFKEEQNLNGRPGPMLPGWKFEDILPTLTQKACENIALQAKAGKPFFLYLPLTSPHEPIAPSAKFQGKSGISPLADFIMETDWAVGEVLTALKEHKQEKNTLVFFACDNGHAKYTGLPALEKAGHTVSGPLRGYKADIWEGGHRVPFIVRWPGTVKASSTCDSTICHTNLLATCVELLGEKLPDTAGEDSHSILALLRGEKSPERALVHQGSDGTLALRQGKWKLIMTQTGREQPAELYDLHADLGETKDIAGDNGEVVASLTKVLTGLIEKGRSTPGASQKNDVAVPLRVAPAKAKKK